MKAAQIRDYGTSEVIEIRDIEKPSLKTNQVLVEVKAASLNPVDYKLPSGMLKDYMPLTFPATLGGDFSGVITEIGEGVSDYKVGDEVFGSALTLNGGSGSLAQFAASNTQNMALKPKTIDFTQAASLPLVGASAIQAIEEHINLQKGQKILIQGGAGGIGSIAVQLSKMHGAFVAATAASEDVEFVKGLGADQVIDYKSEDFSEILKDFDAVYDTVGGEVTDKSFKVLKKGGILVSMVGQPNEELAKQYEAVAIGQGTKTTSEKLKHLAQLVDSGKIKPQVDKIFPLEQIKEAFGFFEKVHPRGKVVVSIE